MIAEKDEEDVSGPISLFEVFDFLKALSGQIPKDRKTVLILENDSKDNLFTRLFTRLSEGFYDSFEHKDFLEALLFYLKGVREKDEDEKFKNFYRAYLHSKRIIPKYVNTKYEKTKNIFLLCENFRHFFFANLRHLSSCGRLGKEKLIKKMGKEVLKDIRNVTNDEYNFTELLFTEHQEVHLVDKAAGANVSYKERMKIFRERVKNLLLCVKRITVCRSMVNKEKNFEKYIDLKFQHYYFVGLILELNYNYFTGLFEQYYSRYLQMIRKMLFKFRKGVSKSVDTRIQAEVINFLEKCEWKVLNSIYFMTKKKRQVSSKKKRCNEQVKKCLSLLQRFVQECIKYGSEKSYYYKKELEYIVAGERLYQGGKEAINDSYLGTGENFLTLCKFVDGKNHFKCSMCDKLTKAVCSICRLSYYCCKEHQNEDWKDHKKYCFSWTSIMKKR